MSDALSKIGESFLSGINLRSIHARAVPELTVKVLEDTPITWIRIHDTFTRHLEERNEKGLNYLDGMEIICKAGYNLIVPIDLGVVENVGKIPIERLDEFIEESYEYSKKATSQIYSIVKKYDRKVIFGVENEIDTKEMVLQATPLSGWRGETKTWVTLAMDVEKKYQRLNNILAGIKDAAPGTLTITNVEADDVEMVVGQMGEFASTLTSALGAQDVAAKGRNLIDKLEDWKIEMQRVQEKLNVDLVGIDNYPNYASKWPVSGTEIGSKTDEAARISGKPAMNLEFGYSTYRSFTERLRADLFRKPSAEQMQLEFFKNALGSIQNSSSKGTFPWVTFSEPAMQRKPPEEVWFGLHKLEGDKVAYSEPAFKYYCDWLKSRT
ncbi:hypothetical protein [[Eubacterium] cellulosolvens]